MQECYLDTSKFNDGNVFPTSIGTKPPFEYNFFDVHILLVFIPCVHTFPFLQIYNNQLAKQFLGIVKIIVL